MLFWRVLGALMLLKAGWVWAIEDRADVEPNAPVTTQQPIAWKLTASQYRETQGDPANDLNLRGNRADDAFWVGHYMHGSDFQQTRAGYEHQSSWNSWRTISSLQVAAQGFVGGSLTLEYKPDPQGPWAGLVGWGRTNTRPYVNLNFDPNDSTLVGMSWDGGAAVATLYQVKDDKLMTSQTVTHAVLRWPGALRRWSVDLFTREGRADPFSPMVSGTGLSVNIDQGPYFVRLVWDAKANFTDSDMLRLATGLRF